MAGRHRAYRRPRRKTSGERLVGQAAAITLAAVAVTTGASVAEAVPASADPGVSWDSVAACESGGNWATSTGNGYFGGLQWTLATWHANGGVGSPANATREAQIAVADHVIATQGLARGLANWPVCGKRAGNPIAAPLKRIVPVATGGPIHTVVTGETLANIAAAHGTTWQQLASLNRDTTPDPDLIVVGQSLRLS